MKTNMFNLRHRARIGVGGWRCACCGIPPGQRKAAARAHKKRITRILDKLEKDVTAVD